MKILGVTDEILTCQKCGKPNLKRTVVLLLDNDQVVHYGTDCAARALAATYRNTNRRDVNAIADVVAYAEKAAELYSLAIVSAKVTNRFGYSNEVKNGVLRILVLSQGADRVYAEIRGMHE